MPWLTRCSALRVFSRSNWHLLSGRVGFIPHLKSFARWGTWTWSPISCVEMPGCRFPFLQRLHFRRGPRTCCGEKNNWIKFLCRYLISRFVGAFWIFSSVAASPGNWLASTYTPPFSTSGLTVPCKYSPMGPSCSQNSSLSSSMVTDSTLFQRSNLVSQVSPQDVSLRNESPPDFYHKHTKDKQNVRCCLVYCLLSRRQKYKW